MADIKVELHALDLRQIEAIEQLVAQLQDELKNLNTYKAAHAVALQKRQQVRIGAPGTEELTPEQVEKGIAQLERAQVSHVLAAKAAVFSTSNTLNQLHANRTALLQPVPEDDDDEE